MKPDISTRADVEQIVNQQYNNLLSDPVTAPVFANTDLPHHLPHVYDFWSFIILAGDFSYKRNAFEKHVPLGLKEEHFTKWLQFFHDAVNDHFEGPNAEKANAQADLFGIVFKSKLLK